MMKQFMQRQSSQNQGGVLPGTTNGIPQAQPQSMTMVACCNHCGGLHASQSCYLLETQLNP